MSNAPISLKIGEKFPLEFNYTAPDLEEGEAIQSAGISVSPDDGGLDIDYDPIIGPNSVKQMVRANKAGDYALKITVTTSVGHIYIDTILVKVF